jgi:hypothetical protein
MRRSWAVQAMAIVPRPSLYYWLEGRMAQGCENGREKAPEIIYWDVVALILHAHPYGT